MRGAARGRGETRAVSGPRTPDNARTIFLEQRVNIAQFSLSSACSQLDVTPLGKGQNALDLKCAGRAYRGHWTVADDW